MTNPAAFIHAGLGKCGSSFLQEVWSHDPAYVTANLGAVGEAAQRLAVRGQTRNLPLLEHGLKPFPGQTLIASSEALCWGFLDCPARQPLLPELQRIAASLVGTCELSDTVLIMVRNPVDWIRAAREQTLKEGGSESGQGFIDLHRGLVEHVLDLEHLRTVYAEHFKRVVFLSSDEMRTDPDHFWAVYSEALGVPAPARATLDTVLTDSRRSNRSLGSRQGWLARLNREIGAIADFWAGIEDLPGPAAHARTPLIAQFRNSARWASRRLAEHASDATLEAVFDGDGQSGLPRFRQQFEAIGLAWAALEPVPGHVRREREALLFDFRTSTRAAAEQFGQHARKADLERLDAILSRPPQTGEDEIPLDAALRTHLRHRFCDALEGCTTIQPATLASYRGALDERQPLAQQLNADPQDENPACHSKANSPVITAKSAPARPIETGMEPSPTPNGR